jgi:hypothetical protein
MLLEEASGTILSVNSSRIRRKSDRLVFLPANFAGAVIPGLRLKSVKSVEKQETRRNVTPVVPWTELAHRTKFLGHPNP